ncbi:MAG: response regulator transcription factor [Hydrogenovibrio sp.]|uniref:response regulator transcription factor n=1 Tax=Hydrogenovibrio sp. TaxID=2065821 RepID=UPI00286FCDD7|nr:response regulator transcription factor [Hydrogenovibrio sp.]MDR9498388.1 response regulator transcription factor [Hydrogenovibrio sp.]
MKNIYLYAPQNSVAEHWHKALREPFETVSRLSYEAEKADGVWVVQYQPDQPPEGLTQLLAQQQPVLLLSNQPSEPEGLTWLRRGIRGYLNSFAHADVIAQAISAIRQGNIWVGQNIMQALIQGLSSDDMPPAGDTSWRERLSQREIETVEAILQGKSNREIAQAMQITERTVKSHVHHILEKLEAKDRLNLVIKIQNWHKFAL